MKTRKIFIRALLILLAVVAVGLLLRAVFNFTTGKKLEKHFEQAKAKGMSMALQDLGPACDDTENAAPLWKAAEALILLKEEDRKLLTQTVDELFYGRPLDDSARAKLSRLSENNRKVFELMLEAAERPCFRYGDWSKRAYDVDLPDPVKMINAVRLLGIDAVLKADTGKTEEALEQCRRGMLFVRRVLDEPFLITDLVSIANMKCLLICLNRIASGRDVDPNVLFSIIKDLDPKLWREGFARCLQGEQIFSRDMLLDATKGNTEALKLGFGKKFFLWLSKPLAKSDIMRIQAQYQELEQQVRLPYYQTKEFQAKLNRKMSSLSWYEKWSEMFFPNFSSAMLKEATLESLILTARIGLACKIYKSRQGRFPERVDVLVPGILSEESLDPFTGKAFIYRAQDGGFIVYSLGSNEKDDGGRGTLQITKLIMEKDDDWAWSEKAR